MCLVITTHEDKGDRPLLTVDGAGLLGTNVSVAVVAEVTQGASPGRNGGKVRLCLLLVRAAGFLGHLQQIRDRLTKILCCSRIARALVDG